MAVPRRPHDVQDTLTIGSARHPEPRRDPSGDTQRETLGSPPLVRGEHQDLGVIPMGHAWLFESQGDLSMRRGTRYTASPRGIGGRLIQGKWTNRNANGKRWNPRAQRCADGTHASLTIQCVQCMLDNRMLPCIARPASETFPRSMRAPDEGVEVLARTYFPCVEMGHAGFALLARLPWGGPSGEEGRRPGVARGLGR